jgi:hypothetical protein
LLNKHGYTANIKTLQAADQMMQNLLDIKAWEGKALVCCNEWELCLRN